MGEFDIIAKYFAPLSQGETGAFGLTDDAAVLPIKAGHQLVTTSDCLISGVHFFKTDPPSTIARKVLGVNLSDIASMGASARSYTLAAAWPRTLEETWIEAFAEGLDSAQTEWGVTLVGGDTVATDGPLTLTITAFGEIESGTALTRSGAEPGDIIYVSGTIGDAALGLLESLQELGNVSNDFSAYLIDRYRCPQPRVQLGPQILGLANSAIDISDGLIADLSHITHASKVSALINADQIPLSIAASEIVKNSAHYFETIVSGGDDYEILFTAPADNTAAIEALAMRLHLALTPIGTLTKPGGEPEVTMVDHDGQDIALPQNSGYQHF
jgi:thiamine-monophosphate kinase